MNKTTTIFINNDTSNPIAVQCVISAEKENGLWSWSIGKIISVELVIGDKVGIDITTQVFADAKAKALITEQVANEDDQIVDAITECEDENTSVEQLKETSLFEMFADITRAHAKAFYGIDLNGGAK